MSYVPYNSPLLSPLLGDNELASLFGVKAEISGLIEFERALANSQGKLGLIPEMHAAEIEKLLEEFEPVVEEIFKGTETDGMAIPAFVRQVRSKISSNAANSFHYKCTSQDVIDTCGMMKMRDASQILSARLKQLILAIEEVGQTHGKNRLMAHTRMQAALLILVSDRIVDWVNPLNEVCEKGSELSFPIQLGGPVGSADAYDGKRSDLGQMMAADLELSVPKLAWHNNRRPMIEIGNFLSMLTGHLGKLGADVCLMAQMGDGHIKLAGGGGSSAMPHKQNPVLAESLVSIARFSTGLNSVLQGCLVHEQERSGAAWNVEWMVMPQLFVTAGAAVRNAQKLVHMIERIGEPDR